MAFWLLAVFCTHSTIYLVKQTKDGRKLICAVQRNYEGHLWVLRQDQLWATASGHSPSPNSRSLLQSSANSRRWIAEPWTYYTPPHLLLNKHSFTCISHTLRQSMKLGRVDVQNGDHCTIWTAANLSNYSSKAEEKQNNNQENQYICVAHKSIWVI